MSHLPQQEMVNAPEYVRREVDELVERRPTHQLAIQTYDHIDRHDTMIA